MPLIDGQSNNRPSQNGQLDDELCQHNPSPITEIVRRGQEAMARQRRAFEDWMAIAEALRVGRADVMRAVHTNQPTGKRYEKAMAEWLITHSFQLIEKGHQNTFITSHHPEKQVETGRSRLPAAKRSRFTHPDPVRRKGKAATAVPNPNAPRKPSPVSKLKDSIAQLEEENHRMRREI